MRRSDTILNQATIGVDFALKVLPWDENTTIRLQARPAPQFAAHVIAF
jgi:predicted nucleotidyltransferase